MLLPGYSASNLGDSLSPESALLAVYVEFSKPPRQFNTGFCMFNTEGVCDRCAMDCCDL